MTVTIGRRHLLAALGGAATWPLSRRARSNGYVVGGAGMFGFDGDLLGLPPMTR